MKWVKSTEWIIEMKLEQFNASRNFSGVSGSLPSGMRSDETMCMTPLDAYVSG